MTAKQGPSKAKIACEIVDLALEAGEIELFTSEVDESPYATIRIGGRTETYAVKGGRFSQHLRLTYWNQQGDPLQGEALSSALAHAEMRALVGGRRELYARVAHLDDRVIVDSGDVAWGAYVITKDGWEYVRPHPVPFVRSKGTIAFPVPLAGRSLAPLLMRILRIDAETALLFASWVVCSYCAGPYLVLVLNGEQGSGKSTAAKVLRSLTDPNAVPIRTPPRESRDLVVAARSSHVIAYDNLSSLPQWLSDALSMIATGGGYEARQLYTDLDEVIVRVKRPILLNGIENPAVSADLLDRSLVAAMKPIDDRKRRSEDEIELDLHRLEGELVGAVFGAVSAALRNLDQVPRPSWARMVDATRWAISAAGEIGTNQARLEAALKRNRVQRDELVLEGSVFSLAVIEYAMNTEDDWQGTTAELKAVLENHTVIGRANVDKKDVWPQTIQKVVAVLAREAPVLRRQGVELTDTSRRGGAKVKTLTYRDPKVDTQREDDVQPREDDVQVDVFEMLDLVNGGEA